MTEKTIIILEDDIDLRDHFSLVLEAEGFTVIGVDNGEGILELIDEVSPVLVITDMFMPQHSGTDAILNIIKHNHVPVIAISAYVELIRIVEPLVAAHLHKPVTDKKLVNTVNAVLQKK